MVATVLSLAIVAAGSGLAKTGKTLYVLAPTQAEADELAKPHGGYRGVKVVAHFRDQPKNESTVDIYPAIPNASIYVWAPRKHWAGILRAGIREANKPHRGILVRVELEL